jgi:hypothetical protein
MSYGLGYNLFTYREGECNIDGLAPFVRMAHVTVNLHCLSFKASEGTDIQHTDGNTE